MAKRAFEYSAPSVGPEQKKVHVVFTDMNGSTQLWSDVLKVGRQTEDDTALSKAWRFVSTLQTAILKVMLDQKFGGTFVKGMGDGLIVMFEDPRCAYNATVQAKRAVEEAAEKFIDTKPAYSGFRFVIHSTPVPVILGGYNLRAELFGLRTVHEVGMTTANAPIRHPQSPDLFGHHMNYAARCIGVVAESAIYVTKDALAVLPEDLDIDLEWPLVIGGLKGLGDSVKVQRLTERTEQTALYQEATLRAYKTKVLVYVPSAHQEEAEKKFEEVSRLMREQMETSSDSQKNLVPHVFLACYTKEPLRWYAVPSDAEPDREVTDITDKCNKGTHPAQLILRLETLDLEYLELLLLDTAAQNIFKAGMAPDSKVVVNTETRFIRTAKVERGDPDPWKWAHRGTDLNASIYYLELQPTDVNDIDLYARRIISGQSSSSSGKSGLQVIEVGRLWGDPSIYAIVQWPSPVRETVALAQMGSLMRTPILSELSKGKGVKFGICTCEGGKTMPLKWKW